MHNWDLGGGFLSGPNGGSVQRPSDAGHSSLSQQQQQIDGPEKDHHHHHHLSVPQGLITKGKNKENTSDEDDPSFDDIAKGCPWQRMKWTNEIIRLLIAVVAHVGDDCSPEGSSIQGLKRKSGYLQKKGKWKTVSKIMIKRGCHVSPQQCEDKFNDLNKRYKRLNDILGKGICCQVVENPSLMDSMPKLSSKAKDDVKKILSSKHLFYQEICAYHNGQRIPNCPDLNLQEVSANHVGKENGEAEANDDDDDDDDDDSDSDADEDDEQVANNEDTNFELQMMGKSTLEKKEWIKMQRLQLQEQKLQIQEQSLELEKQRFKWMRYSSKKEREMERMRLMNERMNLENERFELQLTKKELEIGSKRPDLSKI